MEFFVKKAALKWAFGWMLAGVLALYSCDSSRIFDEDLDMENAEWPIDSVRRFSVLVTDTAAYDLFYKVRTASDYGYYNLYLRFTLEDSLHRVIQSELQEVILFDPKTGKPYGSGLGSIFTNDFPILQSYRFPHAGNYSFTVQQYMRTETLPGIHSIGLRIEKSR